jgi:hypothetical protein
MKAYLEDRLDAVVSIRKQLEYQKKSMVLDCKQYNIFNLMLDELENIYKILLEVSE